MIALGFVCVLIAANRPPDLLIAGAILPLRRGAAAADAVWLAGAAAAAGALLYYNLAFVGDLAAGTRASACPRASSTSTSWGRPGCWSARPRGSSCSRPSSSSCPWAAQRLRDPETRRLAIALGIAVVGQLIAYSQTDWRGGSRGVRAG